MDQVFIVIMDWIVASYGLSQSMLEIAAKNIEAEEAPGAKPGPKFEKKCGREKLMQRAIQAVTHGMPGRWSKKIAAMLTEDNKFVIFFT